MFEEFTYRDGRIREPWKHRFYCIASRDSRWEPVSRGCIEKICKGCIWEVLVRSCPSLFEIVFLYVCSHVRADILGRIYWRFIRIEKWIGWPWARALFIGWPYVVITWKEKRDDGIVGKFDNTFFIVDMIWHMKKGWKSKEIIRWLCIWYARGIRRVGWVSHGNPRGFRRMILYRWYQNIMIQFWLVNMMFDFLPWVWTGWVRCSELTYKEMMKK